MANYIENLGLSELLSEEDVTMTFIGNILVEPSATYEGYSGIPVIRRTCRDAEFSVRTEPTEDGNLEVSGIDTHCANRQVWNVKVISQLDYEYGDCNSRLLLVNKEFGGGGAIINVINADVIPSYVRGDRLTIQVVGFPTQMEVYDSEEEYLSLLDEKKEKNDGKSFTPAIGSIFPYGIMNKSEEAAKEKDQSLNIMCGRFKGWAPGRFKLNDDNELETFVRLLIETEFGDIELAVNPEEMPDEVPMDSIILAIVVISGDPAIFDYDKGIVRDEKNDLRVVRHAVECGEANRLKAILADNCTYTSDVGQWEKHGAGDVIELYKYIHDTREINYITHMATLVAGEIEEELEYNPGKRVLILENEEGNLESMMVLDYDDEGDVADIKVIADTRYKFQIDKEYEEIIMPLD